MRRAIISVTKKGVIKMMGDYSLTEVGKSMKSFVDAAIDLCEKIEVNDAEEVISNGYPFELSFDEVVHSILNWYDTQSELHQIMEEKI